MTGAQSRLSAFIGDGGGHMWTEDNVRKRKKEPSRIRAKTPSQHIAEA